MAEATTSSVSELEPSNGNRFLSWGSRAVQTVSSRLRHRGDEGWGETWTPLWQTVTLLGLAALAAVALGGGDGSGDQESNQPQGGGEIPTESSGTHDYIVQASDGAEGMSGISVELCGFVSAAAMTEMKNQNHGSTVIHTGDTFEDIPC